MKIIFLTGSLEKGRTGVGDYTRLLASECKRLGHEVQTIALNDLFIKTIWNGELSGVQCLRLPEVLTWQDRWSRAKRLIERFNPDWVSIQFVPYAFHPKGLFKEFLQGIPILTAKQNVHVTFHEIWIGEYPRAPIKERFIGSLQKKMICKLLQVIDPMVVNYTNAGAMTRMQKAGLVAQHLPIFGNIKVSDKKEEGWLFEKLNEANRPVSKQGMKGFLWFGFFGSIHDQWPARQILERLRMFTTAQDKRPGLLHAGIIGNNRKRWREIKSKYAGDWLFHSFGELDEDEISQYLLALDYGLTSTPWDLVGKSGTIAAMVEHGLPVIVNIEGGTPDAPLIIQDQFKPLIVKSDEKLLQHLNQPLKQKEIRNNLAQVAEKFLNQLHSTARPAQSRIAYTKP